MKKCLYGEDMINPRHFYYALDRMKNVVRCGAAELELLLRNPDEKIVRQEYVGEKFISTVFLGIDHYYGDLKEHPPVVFETMIFDESDEDRGRLDIYCDRYTSYEDALKGHEKAVKWAKEGCLDEAAEQEG